VEAKILEGRKALSVQSARTHRAPAAACERQRQIAEPPQDVPAHATSKGAVPSPQSLRSETLAERTGVNDEAAHASCDESPAGALTVAQAAADTHGSAPSSRASPAAGAANAELERSELTSSAEVGGAGGVRDEAEASAGGTVVECGSYGSGSVAATASSSVAASSLASDSPGSRGAGLVSSRCAPAGVVSARASAASEYDEDEFAWRAGQDDDEDGPGSPLDGRVEGAIDDINRSRDAMNEAQLLLESARVKLAAAERKREREVQRLRGTDYAKHLSQLDAYEALKERTAARRRALAAAASGMEDSTKGDAQRQEDAGSGGRESEGTAPAHVEVEGRRGESDPEYHKDLAAVESMEAECLRLACALGPVFEALVPYFTVVAVMDAEVADARKVVDKVQEEVRECRRAYHAAMDHLETISLEIQSSQRAEAEAKARARAAAAWADLWACMGGDPGTGLAILAGAAPVGAEADSVSVDEARGDDGSHTPQATVDGDRLDAARTDDVAADSVAAPALAPRAVPLGTSVLLAMRVGEARQRLQAAQDTGVSDQLLRLACATIDAAEEAQRHAAIAEAIAAAKAAHSARVSRTAIRHGAIARACPTGEGTHQVGAADVTFTPEGKAGGRETEVPPKSASEVGDGTSHRASLGATHGAHTNLRAQSQAVVPVPSFENSGTTRQLSSIATDPGEGSPRGLDMGDKDKTASAVRALAIARDVKCLKVGDAIARAPVRTDPGEQARSNGDGDPESLELPNPAALVYTSSAVPKVPAVPPHSARHGTRSEPTRSDECRTSKVAARTPAVSQTFASKWNLD